MADDHNIVIANPTADQRRSPIGTQQGTDQHQDRDHRQQHERHRRSQVLFRSETDIDRHTECLARDLVALQFGLYIAQELLTLEADVAETLGLGIATAEAREIQNNGGRERGRLPDHDLLPVDLANAAGDTLRERVAQRTARPRPRRGSRPRRSSHLHQWPPPRPPGRASATLSASEKTPSTSSPNSGTELNREIGAELAVRAQRV